MQFGSDLVKKFGVQIAKGKLVVAEGDTSKEMYIVHKGKLQVLRGEGDNAKAIGYISEGEFFGELSLLNNEARSATIMAVESSVLLRIPPKAFQPLIKKFPDFGIKVIIALAKRLGTTNAEIAGLQEQEEDLKLLKSLLSKVNSIGEKSVKGTKIAMTIDAIASEIKTPSDTLTMIKADLQNASNVVTMQEDGMEFPSLDLLKEFIDFIKLRKKVMMLKPSDKTAETPPDTSAKAVAPDAAKTKAAPAKAAANPEAKKAPAKAAAKAPVKKAS